MDRDPPFLIIDKAFWLCPVHVLTGAIFFVTGFALGAALVALS